MLSSLSTLVDMPQYLRRLQPILAFPEQLTPLHHRAFTEGSVDNNASISTSSSLLAWLKRDT